MLLHRTSRKNLQKIVTFYEDKEESNLTLREALEKHLGHCLTDAQFDFYCKESKTFTQHIT